MLDTLNAKTMKNGGLPNGRMLNKGLIVKRDLDGGQMSRDMTLYVEEGW